MDVASVMFSLLRSELQSIALPDGIRAELTSDLLKDLYELSDKHDVAHIVASSLLKIELPEGEISKKFSNKLMMAVYRDTQREYALTQICSVLEQSGIPHIPLKGAVIRRYYPQSWMRTSCDIDILVHEEDSERALQRLCEAGFVRGKDSTVHDYSLFSTNNVHVELHYTLSQDGELPRADEILSRVWESAQTEKGSSCCYSMTAEMFVLYHIVHMARHLVHGGCGIRPFIDLWFLQHHMPCEEEKLTAILSEAGLLDLFHEALLLGRVWMENAHGTEGTELLSDYVLIGGVYGTAHNSAQIKAAKGQGKAVYFRSLIFLPRDSLEVMYPNLKKHRWMAFLYQIKRWFRVFNRAKRRKIRNLTVARNDVSRANVESTKTLLQNLGLYSAEEDVGKDRS